MEDTQLYPEAAWCKGYETDRIWPFMLLLSGLPLLAPTDWIQVEPSINRACDNNLQGLTSPWDKKARMEKGQTVSRAA